MDSSYRLTAAADESARTSKKFSENFDSQRESHSDIKQESDCENQFCRSKSETYDGSSLQGSHQAAITIRSNCKSLIFILIYLFHYFFNFSFLLFV